MEIEIYTDGACSGNPGKGGYGIILLSGKHVKEISAAYKRTTNNRMELLAVIVALQSIKKPGANITIYSDSKYVCDSISLGWVNGWVKTGFKNKKNPDLWKMFLELQKLHQIKMKWVKGHADNMYNNRCDLLATQAIINSPLLTDDGYEGLAKV
jgi:ribonuclease HI